MNTETIESLLKTMWAAYQLHGNQQCKRSADGIHGCLWFSFGTHNLRGSLDLQQELKDLHNPSSLYLVIKNLQFVMEERNRNLPPISFNISNLFGED